MFDHIGFPVRDLGESVAFYEAALAPLGIERLVGVTPEQSGAEAHVGFGAQGRPFFWIATGLPLRSSLHVAFTAQTREIVDAFYNAALKAGGRDNGAPGLRPHYHPNYYGAFVLDLDGNNVEAVCHAAN